MNHVSALTQMTVLLIVALLTTGCNIMNVSMNDIKYGQLYTMQEALEEAAADCSNNTAISRAINWAVIGYNDLENSHKHMARTSVKFSETRQLMRSLSSITARRINTEKLCNNIALVAKQGREYLANIDNDIQVTEQPVTLAMVRH